MNWFSHLREKNLSYFTRNNLLIFARATFVTPARNNTIHHKDSIQLLEHLSKTSLDSPSEDYFKQLTREEKNQFGSPSRKRTLYTANCAASISLPFSLNTLKNNTSNEEQGITLCKDYIIEHSNRRVDLFFYTLIAYYKSEFFSTRGRTYLQHGRGGRPGQHPQLRTQACHSSFLPSLVDKTIYHNQNTGKQHRCQLSGTHFMDSLNTTIELPGLVNHFDQILENQLECRILCLNILRHVTSGALNPIEGLTLFLTLMDHLLNQANYTEQQNKKPKDNYYPFWGCQQIPTTLIDIVAQGTLETTFSKKTQSVSKPYIHSLLGLFGPKTSAPGTKEITEKDCLDKIKVIQHQLLSKS